MYKLLDARRRVFDARGHLRRLSPGTQNVLDGRLEVGSIASYESQAVDLGRGCDERVAWLHRSAHGFAAGYKPAGQVRYVEIDRDNPFLKARCELVSQPFIEPSPTHPI